MPKKTPVDSIMVTIATKHMVIVPLTVILGMPKFNGCTMLTQFASATTLKSTIPKSPATIVPNMIPINTEIAWKKPLKNLFTAIIIHITNKARHKFTGAPKVGLPTPPATFCMPMGINEKPIIVTIEPVTTWGKNLNNFTI